MSKNSWTEKYVPLNKDDVYQHQVNSKANALIIHNPDIDIMVYLSMNNNLSAIKYEKIIKPGSVGVIFRPYKIDSIFMLADGGNVNLVVTELWTDDPIELLQHMMMENIFFQEMPLLEKNEASGIYSLTANVETIIDTFGYKKIELINRGGGIVWFDVDREANGQRPNLMLIPDEGRSFYVRCQKLRLFTTDSNVRVEVGVWR